jgi:hypothetical protein
VVEAIAALALWLAGEFCGQASQSAWVMVTPPLFSMAGRIQSTFGIG